MGVKLLDAPWGIDEQFDMLMLPFVKWTWLMQYKVAIAYAYAEIEKLFEWVPYYEHGYYDAAILHLDLNHDGWTEDDRITPDRRLYEDLNTAIEGLPKIVIIHGADNGADINKRTIRRVNELVAGNYSVVASTSAAVKLGFGHVITPGIYYSPQYEPLKELRVVTNIRRATTSDLQLIEALRCALAAVDIQLCRIGIDYIPLSAAEYRNFLRHSMIYYAPPSSSRRETVEAMMNGCCVLEHRSVDCLYMNDGLLDNGDMVTTAKLIERLIFNPSKTLEIGQEGAKTARNLYDWNRYADEWRKFLAYVIYRG